VAFHAADDHLLSDSVRNCSFIPLRGVLATGPLRVPVDPDGAHVLTGPDEPLPLRLDEISALLRSPAHALRTGISTSLEEMREGLHLWLVTHQPGVYTLWGGARVPDLFGWPDRSGARGTLCLMDSRSLVLLAWADESVGAGELVVLAPIGSDALAARARRLLADWQTAGRPTDNDLEIRSYAHGDDPKDAPDEHDVIVEQRWSRFFLNWTCRPARQSNGFIRRLF
jgi:hypothetical protein